MAKPSADSNSGLLQTFRSLALLLVLRAANLGIGLISSLLIATSLVAEDYGIFTYAMSFQTILAFAGCAGMRSSSSRAVVRRPRRAGRMLTAYLVASSVLSLVSTSLLMLAMFVRGEQVSGLWAVFAFGLVAIASNLTVSHLFDALGLAWRGSVFNLVMDSLGLLALLGLMWSGGISLYAVLGVTVLRAVAVCVVTNFYFIRDVSSPEWPVRLTVIRHLVLKSLPLAAAGLIASAPLYLQALLSRWCFGVEQTATVGWALQFSATLLSVGVIVDRYMQPYVHSPEHEIRWVYSRWLMASLTTVVSAAAVGFLCVCILVQFAFAARYANANAMVAAYLLAAVVFHMGKASGEFLIRTGASQRLLLTVTAGLVCFALSYALSFAAGAQLFAGPIALGCTGAVLWLSNAAYVFRSRLSY
ncbi:hypothetical protein [Rubinisphaera sp. JC750]|uniref:hypothetical protein n=1 Tax=Rubinisphaera sp. JC750 TaxID=2898658 RepID=UPI001F330215|nr:hypothetical protein [Rubinisphaera sp. JC750]